MPVADGLRLATPGMHRLRWATPGMHRLRWATPGMHHLRHLAHELQRSLPWLALLAGTGCCAVVMATGAMAVRRPVLELQRSPLMLDFSQALAAVP